MIIVQNRDGSPLSEVDLMIFGVARAIVRNFPDAFEDSFQLAVMAFITMNRYGLYNGTLTALDVDAMIGKLDEAIRIVYSVDV